MTNRTLRDANTVHDTSNETLRFNRTMQDAGLHGSFERDEPHGIVVFVFGLIGAIVLWIFLALILS